MDGPSGLNQPRRKSRLRSRDNDYVRPPAAPLPGEAESIIPEETPIYDPGLDVDVGPISTPHTASATDIGEAPQTEDDDDELPEAFRLQKIYSAPEPARNPLTDWRWLLAVLLLVSGGLVGGYTLGQRSAIPAGVSPRVAFVQANRAVLGPLDPKVQKEVDDAFGATKKGAYADARLRFSALREKHPEWPSVAVEVARAALYEHDSQGAQGILGILTANRLTPDADFMMALLHLTNKEFDLAETSFGTAVALDPTRPDFFYFWGECLRRDGKPKEAIDKFRSALLRNQYENSEGLYQLKLWLSEIQSDQEEASGGGKEIDNALAQARPPYEGALRGGGPRHQAEAFCQRRGLHHAGAGDHGASGVPGDYARPDVPRRIVPPRDRAVLQVSLLREQHPASHGA